MRWLQEQHSGSERLRGMLVVVALWASEDSESALLWLESHAEGPRSSRNTDKRDRDSRTNADRNRILDRRHGKRRKQSNRFQKP